MIERKRNTIRGGERPRGNERRRERRKGGGSEGGGGWWGGGVVGEEGGRLGGAEEGISHIEMRVLLSVFSLSPCITPWITTTPPLCRRNFQTHPQHAHKHTPPSPSSFPPFLPPSFRSSRLHRTRQRGIEGREGEANGERAGDEHGDANRSAPRSQFGSSVDVVDLCVCVCFSIIFSKYTNNKQLRLSIVSR